MTIAQTVCLIESKYGAPPSIWADMLPTWLMDAIFSSRYRAMLAHGRAYSHLDAEQRRLTILEREYPADD